MGINPHQGTVRGPGRSATALVAERAEGRQPPADPGCGRAAGV